MTDGSHSVVLLRGDVLRRSSHATKQSLLEVINRAYDVPKDKFGIITSSRVRSVDSFCKDLGFDNVEEQCWLYLLLNDRQRSFTGFNSEFRQVAVKVNAYEGAPALFVPNCYALKKAFEKEEILATIGFKPHDIDTYEVTAFTSVVNGCGVKLFSFSITRLIQVNELCTKLLVSFILEHDLVGYYKKLGFTEISKLKILKDNGQQKVFSDEVEFSRDFHILQMEKSLR